MVRWAALICLALRTFSQTLPNPSRCVANSNVTSFSACSSWYDTFSTCSAYAASSQAYSYYNCYCQQRMLDAIVEYILRKTQYGRR